MGCNGQWFMGPLWSATLKKVTHPRLEFLFVRDFLKFILMTKINHMIKGDVIGEGCLFVSHGKHQTHLRII